jgi:hypothetical protein
MKTLKVEPNGKLMMARKILLVCGILSSLLYVAMNIISAMLYEGYNSTSQTVSELSAIGAPTRPVWLLLGIPYTLLATAFGCGVWVSASRNRPLRVVGGLMIAYGVIGLFWPPMHMRGAGFTLTDTMHIVFAMVTVLLMLLAIGFGAAAFGKRFRLYSIATIALLVVFGALTGLQAPRIAENLPTPLVGIWERINIGVFLLWVMALAIALLRGPGEQSQDDCEDGPLLPPTQQPQQRHAMNRAYGSSGGGDGRK